MITNDMVSLAAGPTDLCLLTVLTDVLALPLVGAAGEQVRQEGQQQQDGPGLGMVNTGVPMTFL